MLRLLIIVLFAYLIYRVVRGFILPALKSGKTNAVGSIDEMVQDPFCKTYIPLRDAQKMAIEGKEYFFCSQECYEKFEGEMKKRGRD